MMGYMGLPLTWSVVIVSVLATADPCPGQSTRPAFADEPAAHALYDQMIAAFRAAQTLHWDCDYEVSALNEGSGRTYEVWLAKPNFFRVEAAQEEEMGEGGALVGDGEAMWKYWPQGRPKDGLESDEQHRQTCHNVYMTKPSPPGQYSISYEIRDIGLYVRILDPSTFHGYTDPLQKYIDGVRALPAEKVEGVECDVIEVSFMKGQRSWTLWIARIDHLPRRLKQVNRVKFDVVTEEDWSNVAVNEPIPASRFSWKPPEGWQAWHEPDSNSVPKLGTVAPDFALAGGDGKTIRLSQYRGQVVLLYLWRAGVPQCREGMRRLQTLLDRCGSQGFAILGFNVTDNREIALEELRRQDVRFPSVIDTSQGAWEVHYKYPDIQTPTYYLIDRRGRIAEAWAEDDQKNTHLVSALAKLGIAPPSTQASAPAK